MKSQQTQPKGQSSRTVMQFLDKFYDRVPTFSDMFDEETFYIAATIFTLVTCLAAFVASRYITIKARD